MQTQSPIVVYEAGTCSLGSLIVADWTGQPFRVTRATVELMKSPAYARLNPRAQVPALVLPDRVLTESLAILLHLASRSEPASRARLFRPGSPDFDRLNQILAFLTSGFHAAWVPVFHPYRYADDARDQATIRTRALESVKKKLSHIETDFLQDELFFAEPTVADAYFFGLVRWGVEAFGLESFPKTQRFVRRMQEEPSVRFALSVEAGGDEGARGAFEGRVSLQTLLDERSAAATGEGRQKK